MSAFSFKLPTNYENRAEINAKRKWILLMLILFVYSLISSMFYFLAIFLVADEFPGDNKMNASNRNCVFYFLKFEDL
jgi:hypothetical protein